MNNKQLESRVKNSSSTSHESPEKLFWCLPSHWNGDEEGMRTFFGKCNKSLGGDSITLIIQCKAIKIVCREEPRFSPSQSPWVQWLGSSLLSQNCITLKTFRSSKSDLNFIHNSNWKVDATKIKTFLSRNEKVFFFTFHSTTSATNNNERQHEPRRKNDTKFIS